MLCKRSFNRESHNWKRELEDKVCEAHLHQTSSLNHQLEELVQVQRLLGHDGNSGDGVACRERRREGVREGGREEYVKLAKCCW